MSDFLFDTSDPYYRDPVGAVPTGTTLRIRAKAASRLGLDHMQCVLRWEPGNVQQVYDMQRAGQDGDYQVYSVALPNDSAGLGWFTFRGFKRGKPVLVGKSGHNAVVAERPTAWQVTVYDASFTTPDWIKGGVFYHIFVDRFAYGKEGPLPAKEGSVLRKDWGGLPAYLPDENGKILNNDFFGGNLSGVKEKLPYLKSLGVTCLYISPVFEAASNHKYDTADYMRIDPMFGSNDDFEDLCVLARAQGIHIVCDGVFNHTGADSVYFNKYAHFDSVGAFQSAQSPYYPWYSFSHFPDGYESWWGIDILPSIKKESPEFREFINTEKGVVRHWLEKGASGWRLDVADELSGGFIENLSAAAKAEKPDALIIGEVWEDASNKIAYDQRKFYLQGKQLDSVMNYPFMNAIIRYVRYADSVQLADTVEAIVENYPACVLHCLMNMLGTHDTRRVATALAGDEIDERPREEKSHVRMSPEQWATAIARLKLASLIQFTLPGVPCVFYGDEAGVEGYGDPFNRKCYPWGQENKELIAWYSVLGSVRRRQAVYAQGGYRLVCARDGVFAFERFFENECVLTATNCSDSPFALSLDGTYMDLFTLERYSGLLQLEPMQGVLLYKKNEGN